MGLWVMGVLSSEFYGVWGMGVSAPSFLWAPPPPPKCLLNLYLLNLSVFTGNPCKNRRAQRAEKNPGGILRKSRKPPGGGGGHGLWGMGVADYFGLPWVWGHGVFRVAAIRHPPPPPKCHRLQKTLNSE